MIPPAEPDTIVCASCGEHTPTVDACASCGDPVLLQERYRLLEIAGHGARGTIYRALDTESGRQVAIKELSIRHVDDPKLVELCQREAQLLQQLHHSGIPHYVDDFVAGTGRSRCLYLVQDFVEGRSLNDEMTNHRYREEEVMEILRELSVILDYLHSLSPPVIHRDIKPGNVMRRKADGRLVLVDFGSARDFIAAELGASTVAGTFGYMAPEQFQGEAVPATDIYGLGALAVGLLSRRDPASLHDYQQRFNWDEALTLNAQVQDLLGAMLEPNPIGRISDAGHLQHRIDQVLAALRGDESAVASPSATPSAPPRSVTRQTSVFGWLRRRGRWFAASMAMVTGGILAVSFSSSKDEATVARRTETVAQKSAERAGPDRDPSVPYITLFVDEDAETIHVPDDAATIQAALEAVPTGGSVVIAPGVYLENLGSIEKDVAIRGLGESGSVVIDGQGRKGLSFSYGRLFLENLTFSDSEIGVEVLREGTLVMNRCVLTENHWGVRGHTNGPIRVFDSLLHHNKVGLAVTYYGDDGRVVGSTFADNTDADINWNPLWSTPDIHVLNSVLTGAIQAPTTAAEIRLYHSIHPLSEITTGVVLEEGNLMGENVFEAGSSDPYALQPALTRVVPPAPRGLRGPDEGAGFVGYSGASALSADASGVVFQTTEPGTRSYAEFTLYNFSDASVRIQGHDINSSEFSLETALPAELPSLASMTLMLTFHPSETATHEGVLTLHSDGLADGGGVSIPLRGAGAAGSDSTIRVPEDAPTIQAAVDVLADGMTIAVAPGTYRENVEIAGKEFLLVGTAGADRTILDAGGQVGLHIRDQASGQIRGLTIQNASTAIWADAVAVLKVETSRILDSDVGLAGGRGGELHIRRTLLAHNREAFTVTYGGSPSTIVNATFADNLERDILWNPLYSTARLEVENSILTGTIHAGNDGQPVKLKYSLYDRELAINRVDNLESNLAGDPRFANLEERNYRLQADSPCIDAGDPDRQLEDNDGSRNDMGFTGGP